MLKRILDAWPYALALAVGFVVWSVAVGAMLEVDPSADMAVILLWVYILQPLALLIGALILSFRRGFDWVTLLVCLAVYVVGLVVVQLALWSVADAETFLVDTGTALLAFFVPPALIGTAIGLGVRALSHRTRATAGGPQAQRRPHPRATSGA